MRCVRKGKVATVGELKRSRVNAYRQGRNLIG